MLCLACRDGTTQAPDTTPSHRLLTNEKIINDDVQFYWSMVASNWEDEVADVLLEMIIDEYVKIRGHSTASAWLEQYKRDSKKQVQKSKGVRKQLISKPTSTSTSKTAPSGVSEDPDQV